MFLDKECILWGSLPRLKPAGSPKSPEMLKQGSSRAARAELSTPRAQTPTLAVPSRLGSAYSSTEPGTEQGSPWQHQTGILQEAQEGLTALPCSPAHPGSTAWAGQAQGAESTESSQPGGNPALGSGTFQQMEPSPTCVRARAAECLPSWDLSPPSCPQTTGPKLHTRQLLNATNTVLGS